MFRDVLCQRLVGVEYCTSHGSDGLVGSAKRRVRVKVKVRIRIRVRVRGGGVSTQYTLVTLTEGHGQMYY